MDSMKDVKTRFLRGESLAAIAAAYGLTDADMEDTIRTIFQAALMTHVNTLIKIAEAEIADLRAVMATDEANAVVGRIQ